MNTERNVPGKKIWLMPLLLALPFLALLAFAAFRFGPALLRLISAAVKLVVVA